MLRQLIFTCVITLGSALTFVDRGTAQIVISQVQAPEYSRQTSNNTGCKSLRASLEKAKILEAQIQADIDQMEVFSAFHSPNNSADWWIKLSKRNLNMNRKIQEIIRRDIIKSCGR
jgi:hypothetical protein